MKNLKIVLLQFIFVLIFGAVAWAQFSTPQIIGDTIGESDLPHISSEGSDVYLAWRGDAFVNGVAETQVLFRRSVDSGLNWRETLNLSEVLPADTLLRSPTGLDLAVTASNVYVVWTQAQDNGATPTNGNGHSKIFGVVSNNGGLGGGATHPKGFSPIDGFTTTDSMNSGELVRGDDLKGDALCPAIAASGNNIYLAWLDNRIIPNSDNKIGAFNVFYSMSMDGGDSFTAVQTLSSVMAGQEEAFCPDIAVSGGSVVVAWPETTTITTTFQTEIQYRTSTDSGQTFFGTPTTHVIDEVTNGNITSLQLVAEGNVFLATWVEEGTSESQVMTAYSLNHGEDFTTTNNNNNAIPDDITRYPSLSLKDGTAWLVLSQEENNESNILIFRSDDGGQVFTQVETISSTTDTTNSIQPSVTAFYGRIHVAWMDDSGGSQRKFKIHYRNNLPNTTSDHRQISEDLGISDMPSIGVEGSNVYVAYRSDNIGTGASGRQIIFRRSVNFGVTFEPGKPLSQIECTNLASTPAGDCFSEVRNPEISVLGDFVMVVWQQRGCNTCTFDIMMAYSNDGGTTFKLHPIPPATTPVDKRGLNISKLLLACDYNGTTTGGIFDQTRNDVHPSVALNDGFVYLTWSYDDISTGFKVLYARWPLEVFFAATGVLDTIAICPTDQSLAAELRQFRQLSSTTTSSTGTLQGALEPNIDVNGARVDVVWFQNRTTSTTGGPQGVFLATSANRGENFESTFTRLEATLNLTTLGINSATIGNVECPSVLTHNNKRYIAWSLNIAGVFQVLLHVSDLGTSTTTLTNPTSVLITSGTNHSRCPSMAAGSGIIYLSWFGRTSGSGSFDVFALQNPVADGTNATPSNISNTAGDSEFPDLAVDDNGRLFAAWLDKTSGKPEIFLEGGIQMAVSTRAAAAVAPSPQPQPTFHVTQLSMSNFTVQILGADVTSVKIEVFNLQGQKVIEQESQGNQLRFQPLDETGRPLSNGVYLYIISGHRTDGSVVRSDIRKLVVLR